MSAALQCAETSHVLRLSSDGLLVLCVVGPRGVLVIERAGFQAAVQDADQAVAELAERGVVSRAAGAELVVVGPCAGRGTQRAERLPVQCGGQALGADEPGRDHGPFPGRTGDRRGAGVVLAGPRVAVA